MSKNESFVFLKQTKFISKLKFQPIFLFITIIKRQLLWKIHFYIWFHVLKCLSKLKIVFLLKVGAAARGWDWYTGYQHKFMSIKSMSLLKPGATRCHGTRIARGVPLPVYINLDLYSGFWCTSRCVVFKYSVPPLTDQALRKVLLTSWKKLTIVVWRVSGLLDVLFSWYTVMIQVQ